MHRDMCCIVGSTGGWILRTSIITFNIAMGFSAAAVLASGGAAYAQEASSGAAAASAAAGIPAAGPNPDHGVVFGDWMLYPSLFAGVVFNDNVYNTAVNRKSGLGIRIRPALEADRDAGIHKTIFYVNGDLQAYPGHAQSYMLWPRPAILRSPTNVSARTGFSHTYQPLPDLKFTLITDFTRGSGGLFGSQFSGAGSQVNVANAAGLTNAGTYTNQVTTGLSVEKQIADRLYLRGSIGAQYVFYDAQPTNTWLSALAGAATPNTAPSRSVSYTASLRTTYWLSPVLYTFVEPILDLRRYPVSWSDTNGYRIVGGFGSDLISLFRGEIYGGYQSQTSAYGHFGATSSPAFGGRLSYYPTQYITLTASVDQTITAPSARPVYFGGLPFGFAQGAPTKTLQARLRGEYALWEYWSAFAQAGYGRNSTSANFNIAGWTPASSTDFWSVGAGVNYNFWRNISLTLEYQFTKSIPHNNALGANWWIPTDVSQNLVTAGLTYRY